MTNFDLVLRGGAAILPGRGRAACDIAICDGRIAAIGVGRAARRGYGNLRARPHCFSGCRRCPPASRPWEGHCAAARAARETAAAAKGGVTCFIPYLMATEPFGNIFDEVVSITQSGARIDFSYHF